MRYYLYVQELGTAAARVWVTGCWKIRRTYLNYVVRLEVIFASDEKSKNRPRRRGKRHLWSASWNTEIAIYVG